MFRIILCDWQCGRKEAALGKDEKRSQAKIMTSLNFSPCCCVMIKGLQKQRPPFYLSILQKGHHLHENGASPASSSLFRYIITGWVKITWNESNLCKIALNFLSNFPIAIYVRHNHHSRLHLHTQIELWNVKDTKNAQLDLMTIIISRQQLNWSRGSGKCLMFPPFIWRNAIRQAKRKVN